MNKKVFAVAVVFVAFAWGTVIGFCGGFWTAVRIAESGRSGLIYQTVPPVKAPLKLAPPIHLQDEEEAEKQRSRNRHKRFVSRGGSNMTPEDRALYDKWLFETHGIRRMPEGYKPPPCPEHRPSREGAVRIRPVPQIKPSGQSAKKVTTSKPEVSFSGKADSVAAKVAAEQPKKAETQPVKDASKETETPKEAEPPKKDVKKDEAPAAIEPAKETKTPAEEADEGETEAEIADEAEEPPAEEPDVALQPPFQEPESAATERSFWTLIRALLWSWLIFVITAAIFWWVLSTYWRDDVGRPVDRRWSIAAALITGVVIAAVAFIVIYR